MSIQVTSTTDSDADVKAAIGDQKNVWTKPSAETVVTEEKPATTEKPVDEVAAASGTAEGEEEDPSEPGDTEERPSKGLDKRFAKLTKKIKDGERSQKELDLKYQDAERQRAYWENEAKKTQTVKETKVETKVEAKPNVVSEGGPKQDDFETYQEYLEARMDWKTEKAEADREVKARENATKSAVDNMWKTYADKEAAFEKENADYRSRLDAVRDAGIKMSPIVQSQILESANPELAYKLMENPEEFKALCAMTPNQALKRIGAVEAQLGSTVKPRDEKVVEIVKQPKPISPVGARATVIKDPEKMSIKEYDAWRRAGNAPA